MLEKITYKRALEMMREHNSLMVSIKRQEHLALHPKYMGNLKQGVTTMLDSLMSLYQNGFEGVPIAYNYVKMVQKQAANISYQPFLHFYINADFIVFKPEVGSLLKGVIQGVEKGHVSCLVHGVFNAWFPKGPLQSVVKDTDLLSLMGSEVEFKVTKLSSNNGVLSLKGDFERILKRKSNNFVSSTPAINKNIFFGDEDDDVDMDHHGSPALDQSFNPTLTSTQVETPFNFAEKRKKRKLSEVLEDRTMMDDSQHESGIGDMDNSRGSKPKKRKHKHGADIDLSMNGEISSSVVSDSQAEIDACGSSKPKKKKKRGVDMNSTGENERSFSFNSYGDMAGNSGAQKKTQKRKDIDEVGTNSAGISDINSSVVSASPCDMAGDTTKLKKKKKHKQNYANSEFSFSPCIEGQESQNRDDEVKANKKHKAKKTHVRQFYSEMSPSPEKDVVETITNKNNDKFIKKGLFQDKYHKRDEPVPSINDFFQSFYDGMKADPNSKMMDDELEVNDKDLSANSQHTNDNRDELSGKTGKKKKIIVLENSNETKNVSMEDFVIEKPVEKKKKKKKKKKEMMMSD